MSAIKKSPDFDPSVVKASAAAGAISDPDESEAPVKKKVTLKKAKADLPPVEVSSEHLEAHRDKEDIKLTVNGKPASLVSVLTFILANLNMLETHMDVLLERTSKDGFSPYLDNLRGKVEKDALSVPTAPKKTYGKEKRATPVETTEKDPSGVREGDFIIEDSEWYKVSEHVAGSKVFETIHHQAGNKRTFKGTVKFLRRTKRKNTACWEIV